MSSERRYQDHEIRQILDLALGEADAPARSLTAADGLTLLELQEVGREVGLPAERIAQAVARFEGAGDAALRGTTLGLPTSVGRIVPLPHDPTEREWELLVAELRTTFGGKGEVAAQGGLREWSFRNMHAFIEPTEGGYRLRLADSNAAVAGIAAGGFLLVFALFILFALLSKEDPGLRLAIPAIIALLGGGMIGGSVIALPRWAREKEAGIDHISRFAATLLAPSESPEA